MGFDLRRAQAEISLGRIPPERFPLLAQNALEAGYDGDTVIRVAILENPSGWETDQLVSTFLSDLGLKVLSKPRSNWLISSQMTF
jgi:hypothetical protein